MGIEVIEISLGVIKTFFLTICKHFFWSFAASRQACARKIMIMFLNFVPIFSLLYRGWTHSQFLNEPEQEQS